MKRTLICGGRIVDGSGESSFIGDVILEGDRIAAVMPRSDAGNSNPVTSNGFIDAESRGPVAPDEVIDATGCLVTPGFIDAHTHSDAYLVLEPSAPSKITQGITTEINGQCGGSVAPRYGEARLSSDWASLLGARLTWHSLAEYREVLAAAKPAVNTVQFIGHNTLRSSVVGYDARPSTDDELKSMIRLLEESLDQGGWGLTTGLIYQPGKYATQAEVEALAAVAATRGGFYATHMRSEGDRILESIDEVVSLVKKTGIRAEISHLKTGGAKNWEKIDAVLEKMDRAVADGLLLGSDRYPYCAAGTDLDVVLPDWAQEGAAKGEMERLQDSALRTRIIDELNASDRDWSSVMIGGTWSPETKPFSGKTIAEIVDNLKVGASRSCESMTLPGGPTSRAADEERLSKRCSPFIFPTPSSSPGEIVCFILEKDLCRTGAFFFSMCEANLDKIYSRSWVVPGSDASLRAPWGPLGADHPHPRAYATMPEFYRRVRALGFSREETIARMTSVPARRFEIRDRGLLRKGAFADVLVWREDAFRANTTYLAPHAFSSGIEAVFVNGTLTYRYGEFTGSCAGRFLER